MIKATHIRLASFTKGFHDKLLSMGFTIKEENFNNTTFIKDKVRNKMIVSSMYGMTLSYKLNYKWVPVYEGLTINLDLLEFFSEKDPLLMAI